MQTTNQMVALAQLKPHPQNYNRHPAEQVKRLAKSLSKFGQVRSVVVWRGTILAGHGVVEAARSLKWESARADVLPDDYPEELALAYVAADNELAKQGDPDLAQLAAILEQSKAADAELLEAIGYSDAEFEALLEEVGQSHQATSGDTEAEIDRAEELRVKWGVESGQLWQLGDHRLICGDCTDAATVARVMGGEKAALAVTSPPYNAGDSEKLTNNTHTDDTKYVAGGSDNLPHDDYLSLLKSSVTQSLSICDLVVVNLQMLSGNKVALIEFLYEFRRKFADVAVWVKDTPQPAMARKVMTSAFEYLWFFSSGDLPTRAIGTNDFRGTISNVYAAPSQRENQFFQVHAATFPVHLPSWILSSFGVSGEIVYEPFSGTGTTLIACENLSRRCRAVEISPAYVAVALERWHVHTGKTPELVSNG